MRNLALARVANGVGPRVAHDPGDPLITSHCPFCGSGQVTGRSDGTIGCDFCGQNYIVRVQPAFPGMPQMPGSPGAPSDAGPDGLVDPGMVGPDGMPMDEGPPGDEEGAPPFGDDDEGPPPGAGGDGDEGAPPPSGDKDDSKKSTKDKGDSSKGDSKKKAALEYRGFGGQVLTEDQFTRHIAVVMSGSHPAVMARLRATTRRAS